jgi:hypothetical protein
LPGRKWASPPWRVNSNRPDLQRYWRVRNHGATTVLTSLAPMPTAPYLESYRLQN